MSAIDSRALVSCLVWAALCGCGDLDDPEAPAPAGASGAPATPAPPAADMSSDVSPSMQPTRPSWWRADATIDERELRAWMRSGRYRDWEATSMMRATDEGASRVWLDPAMARARAAGAASMPVGAVGVRELHEPDFLTPRAINLMIKVADDGAPGGGDWAWYELPADPAADFTTHERGAPVCAGCHGGAQDWTRSPWPLR